MDDIVKQLRDGPLSGDPVFEEAADEIERLRKAVTMAVEALERIGKQSPEHRALVEQVWKDVSQ